MDVDRSKFDATSPLAGDGEVSNFFLLVLLNLFLLLDIYKTMPTTFMDRQPQQL